MKDRVRELSLCPAPVLGYFANWCSRVQGRKQRERPLLDSPKTGITKSEVRVEHMKLVFGKSPEWWCREKMRGNLNQQLPPLPPPPPQQQILGKKSRSLLKESKACKIMFLGIS